MSKLNETVKTVFTGKSDPKYYGPPRMHSNDEDMKLREKEKLDFQNGDVSYNDLLYANYTPCGPFYEMISNLRSNIGKNQNIELGTSFEKYSQDTSSSSKIYESFQLCTTLYQTFYLGRKRNVDKLMQLEEMEKK